MRFGQNQLEQELLSEISIDVAKSVLDRFSTLVRESGSEDERTAAMFMAGFLNQWGIPYQIHNPTIYLSLPRKAAVKVITPFAKEIRAKAPSCSASTGDRWLRGEVVYIAADEDNLSDAFDPLAKNKYGDVAGKVILTDGYPVSGKVKELGNDGAIGVIFISPGHYIHEGTIGMIWGSPDLDTMDQEPRIPALAISKEDGHELIELCRQGRLELQFQTQLDHGWYTCPLLDIFIEGKTEPDKYILLHGHLDSWHYGIGDNGTGNAALLEMARIFHKHRHKLTRSIRIAIWPGHSTGRYAGSTWFADQFGLDLDENCIAQVNCDSPGCRWATSYEHSTWMSEAAELCQMAIHAAVGKSSKGSRPHRAGDYSFNNIGITSFYMLSSSIPDELLQEKGYYLVGGCGSNIEWHTEDDIMHVADLDVLINDIKVYIISIIRVLNAPILPFDFTKTTSELIQTIEHYQQAATDHFSFAAALQEAKQLHAEMQTFHQELATLQENEATDDAVKKANETIRRLARELVTINYSREGKFRHDLAIDMPPLPDIAAAEYLKDTVRGSHPYNVTLTHLVRGQNRIIWALRRARALITN